MTTATTQSRKRVTMVEVVVLLLVIGCGASLLLPMLPASREAARANLCRYNLRQLDLATIEYIQNLRRLPDAATWPTELLPELVEKQTTSRLKLGMDIFTMPRPRLLTCPSHPNATERDPKKQTGEYVLVVDRNQPVPLNQMKWQYRDRVSEPPADKTQPWYLGVEITPEVAASELATPAGPHGGRFLESDGKGKVDFAVPAQ